MLIVDDQIQSKFTHSGDQLQENLRYDFNLGLEDQVRCSFISSLDDLGLSGLPLQEAYLDSYLLHAPLPTATSTFTVWSAMEELVPHHVRSIGVSNVPLAILKRIFDNSRIKPMIVQNRFVPELDYDADVRAFCKDNNIHYQAFGVLKSSGTSALLESSLVKALAVENMVSEESVLYYLIEESLGIEVLNGVPDSRRIIKDLEDIAILRGSTSLPSRCVDWSGVWDEFRELLHPNTIIKSQVQAT